MSRVRIKLVRSRIGQPRDQKETLTALGLRKMHSERELELNPALEGMIRKVAHLLKVEKIG
ncbi:MAG: 50S ribosomal protein L30 [Flavobacteriales bacterium]|nr:50S ribosomal protein L30 [Flavobacteriales bacterium]MCX7651183.1 50S ribosomal protein L30 [Flavobacteriales bacterium]MDW8432490.1 50S ribosomal protein L30 [Flavobacteriales bacterium]